MLQIQCKNLILGYDNHIIQKNLSFEVNEGDYLCILGENGSGKSTLMKTLLKLQPLMGGEIILGNNLKQNDIGYLPQQTLIQKDFPASVKEIVLSGCLGKRKGYIFYTKEDKKLALENIEKMGITDLVNRCYRELSGGQQQRVLLARALCAAKKILFLDEPVAGLDPMVTEEMYKLIEKLNIEEKITIIMISHDLEAALNYSTHILHIGKKYFFGKKDEYINSDMCKWKIGQKGCDDND